MAYGATRVRRASHRTDPRRRADRSRGAGRPTPDDDGEPPVQLKAFQVVRAEPGEARQVEIDIPLDDLAIFDERSGSRRVLPGPYEIHLGVSSAELLLKGGSRSGRRRRHGPTERNEGERGGDQH